MSKSTISKCDLCQGRMCGSGKCAEAADIDDVSHVSRARRVDGVTGAKLPADQFRILEITASEAPERLTNSVFGANVTEIAAIVRPGHRPDDDDNDPPPNGGGSASRIASKLSAAAAPERPAAVTVVRGFLSGKSCRNLADEFSRSRVSRGDDVSGQMVGTTTYGHKPEEYFEKSQDLERSVRRLLNLAPELSSFLRKLESDAHLAGRTFRRAHYRGLPAQTARGLEWTNQGEEGLKLRYHRDDLQVTAARGWQDCEISRVQSLYALNFYPVVPKAGGELVVVNCITDDATNRRLGVAESGYPYPAEMLDRFEKMVVQIGEGDLVIVNGQLLHAVQDWTYDPNREVQRLLLNIFAGRLDDQTAIRWT